MQDPGGWLWSTCTRVSECVKCAYGEQIESYVQSVVNAVSEVAVNRHALALTRTSICGTVLSVEEERMTRVGSCGVWTLI